MISRIYEILAETLTRLFPDAEFRGDSPFDVTESAGRVLALDYFASESESRISARREPARFSLQFQLRGQISAPSGEAGARLADFLTEIRRGLVADRQMWSALGPETALQFAKDGFALHPGEKKTVGRFEQILIVHAITNWN